MTVTEDYRPTYDTTALAMIAAADEAERLIRASETTDPEVWLRLAEVRVAIDKCFR